MQMANINLWIALAGLWCVLGAAQENRSADQGVAANDFTMDFQKLEVGKVPEGFLILEGGFAVQEEASNRFLELPGAPLDTFGVLFGGNRKTGIISARIQGTGKARRAPAFAVGLNGVGGYKLQVSAAKKQIEIFKGDQVLTNSQFSWESGSWTEMRLAVRSDGTNTLVQGKAWKADTTEPSQWMLQATDTSAPITGRASVWGNPFSGTPIRFDDLKVRSGAN